MREATALVFQMWAEKDAGIHTHTHTNTRWKFKNEKSFVEFWCFSKCQRGFNGLSKLPGGKKIDVIRWIKKKNMLKKSN